jgi:hypothetical protein
MNVNSFTGTNGHGLSKEGLPYPLAAQYNLRQGLSARPIRAGYFEEPP